MKTLEQVGRIARVQGHVAVLLELERNCTSQDKERDREVSDDDTNRLRLLPDADEPSTDNVNEQQDQQKKSTW